MSDRGMGETPLVGDTPPGGRPTPVRVLALEPYYGGSHRAVLDGLVERLTPRGFEFDVLTLPARKWKWRMRGSAITMADQVRGLARAGDTGPRWDLLFVSTFLNLAEFTGLASDVVSGIPSLVYFHENQLIYPNRHTAEWDFQFPLTNITSALAADVCVFNTTWNLDRFVQEIPGFLGNFPDHRPVGVADAIVAKSQVLPPPFDATAFDAVLGSGSVMGAERGVRPRIVWPHRWEHDKDPETFFGAVAELAAEGLDFEVVVAGQAFNETDAPMREAAAALGHHLVHIGEPTSREEYARLLASSDIAVSTARNEFFGLAMIEACYAGCHPLVPDRLAYPDLYPEEYRYRDRHDLVSRLRALVRERPAPGGARAVAEPFTLERLVPGYESLFRSVAGARG